jgi:hypothetical protein
MRANAAGGTPVNWSGPYDLRAFVDPERGAFPELRRKGVYRLHLTDAAGGSIPLPRARATDPTGTLYVGGVPNGKYSTVFGRLRDAARTVEYAHTEARVPHRGGWNLYVFGLIDGFSVPHGGGEGTNRIAVFAAVDPRWTASDSERVEASLLLRYRGVFGDNPPANLSAGHIGVDTGHVYEETRSARGVEPAHWFRA